MIVTIVFDLIQDPGVLIFNRELWKGTEGIDLGAIEDVAGTIAPATSESLEATTTLGKQWWQMLASPCIWHMGRTWPFSRLVLCSSRVVWARIWLMPFLLRAPSEPINTNSNPETTSGCFFPALPLTGSPA
jgi:hypothetical protein